MRKRLAFIALAVGLVVMAITAASASAGDPTAGPSHSGGAATTYVPSSSPGAMPFTSGWHCDEVTCIDVLGSGLNVTGLDAEGYVDQQSGCVYPWWYDGDGQLSVYGPTVCWNQGAGQVYSYKPVNRNLPNGDTVCLLWIGSGAPDGNPCVDIHS